MIRNAIIISKNKKDTGKIALEFLTKILKNKNQRALVVGLYGELGSGKTAFTQAVAKYLGVKRKINSPTFVIMKKYHIGEAHRTKLVKNLKYKFLFHLDAYRLKNEKELLYLGWEEIIANREHLVFIEWPRNVYKIMPQKHHKIFIFHAQKG